MISAVTLQESLFPVIIISHLANHHWDYETWLCFSIMWWDPDKSLIWSWKENNLHVCYITWCRCGQMEKLRFEKQTNKQKHWLRNEWLLFQLALLVYVGLKKYTIVPISANFLSASCLWAWNKRNTSEALHLHFHHRKVWVIVVRVLQLIIILEKCYAQNNV